jgi:hypothetical protein
LPLFGIGGWFVPAGDAETKGRVFLFLSVYVATGLSLLVLTSFLGLRRYLRQRKLEMPLDMAATWVALGAALIVAVLGAAAILPRPTSEHSLSSLPVRFTSAVKSASQYAVGKEGTEDSKSDPSDAQTAAKEGQKTEKSGDVSGKPDGKETGSGPKGEKSGGSEKGKSQGSGSDAKGKSSKSGDSRAKSDQGSKGDQGDASQDQSQGQKSDAGQDSKSSDRSGEKSSAKGEKSADAKSSQESQSDQSADSAKGERDSSSKQPQTDSNGQSSVFEEPPQNETAEPSGQSVGSSPSPQPLSQVASWLSQSFATLLRWVFYAMLLVGGLILAWIYREEIIAAWRKLLEELRQLWESLFGRRAAAGEGSEEIVAAPPRPFSAFADPFLTGAAARMSWPQLVRYTFEAVEAWGRERACPRERDQTPHEFAQAIASAEPRIARHVQSLAAWYGQLAYAAAAPPAGSAEPLRELWHNLQRARPVQVE